jgi:hypothetical protein
MHQAASGERRFSMTTMADVPEMLKDWLKGELPLQDVLQALLDLLVVHEVPEVLRILPENIRMEFEASLRESFDGPLPAHEVIWIDSGAGDHPHRAAIVESARRWIVRGLP